MKKGTIFLFLLFVTFIILTGCVTTLESYKPQNPDEAAIKNLLLKWESTWNSHDVQGHLALWNENANIMYGKDRKIASKKEYVNILPERMKAVPKIKLGPPKIKTSDNKADATVDMKMGSYQAPTTYHLVKEGESWSIMSWDY